MYEKLGCKSLGVRVFSVLDGEYIGHAMTQIGHFYTSSNLSHPWPCLSHFHFILPPFISSIYIP